MFALSQRATRIFRISLPDAGRTLSLPPSTLRPGQLCIFCSPLSHPQVYTSRGRGVSSSTHRYQDPSHPSSQTQPTRPDSHLPPKFYALFPLTFRQGPPPAGRFPVDLAQLRTEYLRLQAQAHPDRHPGDAKRQAEATSAYISEAYKTLQNPLLRAQYLLSLRGMDVANDERAKVEDAELLLEVLEARELIEEAEEEEELEPLRGYNDERIEVSLKNLDEAFRADDLGKAKEEAVRLRYWMNIRESLENWEKGKPVVLIH
ncbi:MAG: hypothetical protein M1816_007516 [Peltula sp. TS41687]|nr:MAG: hypothetical protein M1816_007516 [Peltula sp. TS41687]